MIANTPVVKPTSHAMKFLLETYKHGVFVMKNSFYSSATQKTIAWLTLNNFIEIIPSKNPNFDVILITPLGIQTVKTSFLECLTNGYLYRIYPIIKIDDVVYVTQSVNKNVSCLSPTSTMLPEGLYFIKQVNRFALLLVDCNTHEKYRVKMYATREFLKLVVPTPFVSEDEFNSRFGPLKLKALTKQLQKVFNDNLFVIQLLHRVREMFDNEDRAIE